MDAAYKKYLGAIAGAVKAFRARHNVFPIVVAMERLDTKACEALAPQLGGAPVFTSDLFNMYEMVSILRCCSLMVSSRYHAMVTSMPGLVPSAGITMDERIRNLAAVTAGREHLLLTVDDPDLESKTSSCDGASRCGCGHYPRRHGALSGAQPENHGSHGSVSRKRAVHERYPEFPVRSGVHSWEEYLPPLSGNLEQLLNTYEARAAAAAAGD